MATDSGTPFYRSDGSVIFTDPASGGGRRRARVSASRPSTPQPVPIYFQRPPMSRGERVQSAVPTRLGTPVALLMLAGLALVYFALQGWDKKYGTFNGAFAGKGAIPKPTSTPVDPLKPTGDTKGGTI